MDEQVQLPRMDVCAIKAMAIWQRVSRSVTEFRQPLQVQSHLEMPGILAQLGHIQRT